MHPMDPIDARETEIAKIAESKEDIAALQQHVTEIVEGSAFKGSHRSGQFLKYIVDQSIAGHFESLKERVIGMELFGRSPSYDTGEDAIVRVTASDVRKRLLQHYGKYGTSSEFRLRLPLGSYIPEITREGHGDAGQFDTAVAHHEQTLSPHDSAAAASQEPVAISPAVSVPQAGLHPTSHIARQWLPWVILVVALNLALWSIVWNRSSRTEAATRPTFPWSALLNPPHATHLITSDPNIAQIQGFTGTQISASDYANHNYIPEPNKLTPEEDRFCRVTLRGDTSLVDTPIAVSIAELAQIDSTKIDVHAARSIQLSDLKTDDNFIFLGSPRSDPWTALFSDQLDFRFVFDKATQQEIIQNVHPRPHELPAYVPTAAGWATGQSYAVIALVQNLDQNGQVLLLSGANAEGTEAAGKLVNDLPRLASTLHGCGIQSSGPLQHFELLLRLNTMAGSPNNVDIVACHILSGTNTH
ncbi:MAG: hypothetical protein WB608_05590 [Terracidiphilus sp.]